MTYPPKTPIKPAENKAAIESVEVDKQEWVNEDTPDTSSQENPDAIKLESKLLCFRFASGKEIELDLVLFKMQLEEYTKGKSTFSEFHPDVRQLLKEEYEVEASLAEIWQMVKIVEHLWDDFKKKVLEPQMSQPGTT